MDRAELSKRGHALLLRRAMRQAGMTSTDVATALGVSKRSITNWISVNDPVMPREAEREGLKRLMPGYDTAGDGVESAISRSELAAHRKAALIAEYQRHLYEQGRDAAVG